MRDLKKNPKRKKNLNIGDGWVVRRTKLEEQREKEKEEREEEQARKTRTE